MTQRRQFRVSLDTDTPYVAELAKLRAGNPCGDQKRWELACKDTKALLERWGDQAAQLGWRAVDLFGLHPIAPLTNYSEMGLIWILQGREVEVLTADYVQLGNTRFYRLAENGAPT